MTIDGLQTAIETLLNADTWIKPATGPVVSVITSIKGDVESMVAQKLGKLGACIVIDPPTGPLGYSGGNVVFDATIDIFVFENVLLNRGAAGTGKTAGQIAAKVVHLLKSGQPIVITEIIPEETAGKLLVYRLAGMLLTKRLEEPS